MFPRPSGKIACAGLVFTIASDEAWLLEEQLSQSDRAIDEDNAKAAYLNTSLPEDEEDDPSISIMEAVHDDAATPLPSKVGLTQLVAAPTVIILLASYSLLPLHSSLFDIMLPHIGHTASNKGAMGLSCKWMQRVMMIMAILAAIRIAFLVPSVVRRLGLLTIYRRISSAVPVLYAVNPVVGFVMGAWTNVISATLSTIVMHVKMTLTGTAQVLVLLLVLSAAPDSSRLQQYLE